jgi:hypothetical protein
MVRPQYTEHDYLSACEVAVLERHIIDSALLSRGSCSESAEAYSVQDPAFTPRTLPDSGRLLPISLMDAPVSGYSSSSNSAPAYLLLSESFARCVVMVLSDYTSWRSLSGSP